MIVILSISIGYSALNTDLSISGDAVVRVDDEFRIIDVKLVEQTNGAYELYNSNYSKYSATFSVVLPNQNSTITYEVTVENDSPYKYKLDSIKRKNNNDIVYTISNLIGNEVIEEKEIQTYFITLSTTSNNISDTLILDFDFIRYYPNVVLGTFASKIVEDNGGIDFIEAKGIPNLDSVSSTNDGMYAINDNDGVSYYFRGNVDNNYVSFAGLTWRIIRINGDGTVRMILENSINNNTDYYYITSTSKLKMYYKNSIQKDEAKYIIDNWYQMNLSTYDNKIVNSAYCEQARVAYSENYALNSGADMEVYTDYEPRLTCDTDKNGYNIVKEKVGMITYDEVVFAGGYPYLNSNYYLHNNTTFWIISTAGFSGSVVNQWIINVNGYLYNYSGRVPRNIRPVISVLSDLNVTGSGTKENPYLI